MVRKNESLVVAIMICKLCQSEMTSNQNGSWQSCNHCQHYIFEPVGDLHFEIVRVGNMMLDYSADHQEAEIVRSHCTLKIIAMKELTPELALHRLAKLKIYAVMQ